MTIALDGTGTLVYGGRVVEAYPFTMGMMGSRADGVGAQTWLSASQSNGDRGVRMYHASGADNKVMVTRSPAKNGTVNKATAPHTSATVLKWMIGVLTSPTNLTLYFGDNVGQTAADGNTDLDINQYNQTRIGSYQVNSLAATEFAKMLAAEAHWWDGALTSTIVGNIMSGAVDPRDVAGWIDGLSMYQYEPSGNYVSMSGTRTFVASGGVAANATTHPIAGRGPTPAATIAWTEGADVISAAVNVTIEGVAIAAAWTEGADVISIAGTHSTSVGTITTPPLTNNSGFVWANETGVVANVYNASTGAFVVRKTGLTSSALGIVTISDVLIVPGTSYSYEIVLAANGRRLPVGLAA